MMQGGQDIVVTTALKARPRNYVYAFGRQLIIRALQDDASSLARRPTNACAGFRSTPSASAS